MKIRDKVEHKKRKSINVSPLFKTNNPLACIFLQDRTWIAYLVKDKFVKVDDIAMFDM